MPIPAPARAQSKETTGRETSSDNDHVSTKAHDLVTMISEGNLIDPTDLLEMAQYEPLRAALECQKGFSVLEGGYQEQLRRYIAAAYASAFYISKDEASLSEFEGVLLAQRIISKPDIAKTRERLIYRMFELTFAKTGRSTRNTAYRYAHGLEEAFASGVSPTEMATVILKRGPEKLYKEAVKLNRAEKDFAEMLHQRHLDRLKSDGRYACEILGITADNAAKSSNDVKVIPRQQLLRIESEDIRPSILDDDDDDEVQPSWRRRQIDTRFDKITLLANQLSAEIVESKKIIDNQPTDDNDDNSGILRDIFEEDDENWKDDEIEHKYQRLIHKAVELANSSTLLRAILQERVK